MQRIFVNPAIKKALCREAGSDRAWLHKVRQYLGARLSFPRPHPLPGRQSRLQAAGRSRRPDDGCGKELDWWFRDAVLHPKPAPKPKTPPKPKPADHDEGPAGRLPQGADGAVTARSVCVEV